jgi:hypothetical protein
MYREPKILECDGEGGTNDSTDLRRDACFGRVDAD